MPISRSHQYRQKRTRGGWLKKLLGLDEGVFVNTPTVMRTPYGERKPLEFGVLPQRSRSRKSAVVHPRFGLIWGINALRDRVGLEGVFF